MVWAHGPEPTWSLKIGFGSKGIQNEKFRFFPPFLLLIKFYQIKQKVKNGSCSRHSCVNQDDLNECMIYHMKVHIFSYNLGPKKFSKSRICILPNYEQTDSKTAIVVCLFFCLSRNNSNTLCSLSLECLSKLSEVSQSQLLASLNFKFPALCTVEALR